MASFTCALSSPALINGNGKHAPRTHCSPVKGLPPLPSSLNRSFHPFVLKSTIGCHILAKVVVRATGETPAEGETELPEILNTIQETWNKLDDKYAVAALVFALVVALWCSTGLISAVDRLPLLPGIFELVGIGYTGWFVYRNLIFKPDREALITKVKCTYSDIIGKSY
ncbi:Cyanobacterial aminoacyl-tRNA synthetase CAAD domain-containing protein [Dioscorea alata]|uniref:Cyanobacterial aminoacyl-tRNA synthetase CAAD domain-containing protein n=1 Tax=Dioscorea alata TaxID=55571 RepID=A0ACB7WVV4_DIOAL|nr:Cyanobacterial aminoacyl-tRNA synthetase CAAD domain-containing protein [Dioscorea alata]